MTLAFHGGIVILVKLKTVCRRADASSKMLLTVQLNSPLPHYREIATEASYLTF